MLPNDEVKLVEPVVPQEVVDAFENRYGRLFDLSRDDHEWRNTWRYKHDHVQSMWEGWRDGYLTNRHAIPSTGSGETGWQDIASAPKDGREILGICMNAQRPAASLMWWDGKWLATGKPEKFVVNPHGWWPTHWQPLPASPANPAETQAVEVGE